MVFFIILAKCLNKHFFFDPYTEEKELVVSVDETREFFEKEGIKVIEIYAVRGMLKLLSISKEVRESRSWDEKFFRQVTEML